MQISENAQGIVLSYPLWTAAVSAAGALALAALAFAPRARIRRRGPIVAAMLVAAWGAIHLATFRMTITNDAGTAYAFLRYEHNVRWRDAQDIYLERAASGDWRIVVIDREHRAFDFDVADLAVADRDRVMAYMADRMPQSAFAPELMKRRAPHGARPASFAGEQI